MNRENDTQIKREIGIGSATSIVVANIIGAGIFTTSGIMAGMLPGPGWVLACWVTGGLIAIAGSLCYAELATRMPEVGGEYVYLRNLYHPVLGFLTGWTSFIVGFSAPIAASAMGFSEYLLAGLSDDKLVLSATNLAVAKKSLAVSIILVFTLLHYRGIKTGTRVQNSLTGLKVLIVLGLASAGLWLGGGNLRGGAPADEEFHWPAVGTAMMLVMFAYSGWNASAYIAGEMKNPRRSLPLSLVVGTSVVIILYLAVNLFLFRTLSFPETRGVVAIVEKASVAAFGDWMGRLLGVLVSLALLSSLSAFIIIGPRVYYSMARDRLFFRFASQVHPRFGVPGRSIMTQGAIAVVLVLAGSFEQLLVYLGFALGIFPWLAVAGIFEARRRGIGDATVSKVPGYPFTPVFFLLVTITLMVVAYINRPLESTAAVVTVLAGVPCYLIWMNVDRRKKR